MLNEDNWKTANTYSTQLLFITGAIMMTAGLVLSFISSNPTLFTILTPVTVIVASLAIFLLTEKRLQ